MTVHNHMEWVPVRRDGMGHLFALGTGFAWQKRSDLPDEEMVDFETAVEITALEFPPRVAIRRAIGRGE
jgi:hypothetical protein